MTSKAVCKRCVCSEGLTAGMALLAVLTAVVLQVNQVPQTDVFLAINAKAAELMPGAFWMSATLLGDTVVVFCAMAPLLLWRAQVVLALLAAVPLGGLASVALKHYFAGPRPGRVLDPTTFHVVGSVLDGHNSFPSGHTITAFAAAGAVCACLWASRQWPRDRWVTVLALVLAALVGVSRVAVGAHWPWDVLGGAGVGWLSGLGGAWVTRRYATVFQSPRLLWGVLGLLCVCSLGLLHRAYADAQGGVVFTLSALSVWSVVIAKWWRSTPFRYE
jgi:membrane-associated phospholipid phosphatase